jgi:hypothetical protein
LGAPAARKPDAPNPGATPGEGAAPPAAAETVLISHNPVVRLEWIEPEKLYAQTAFVRFYRDEPLPTFKHARWHRIRLHPPAVVVKS